MEFGPGIGPSVSMSVLKKISGIVVPFVYGATRPIVARRLVSYAVVNGVGVADG
jgi:hypothetical protein